MKIKILRQSLPKTEPYWESFDYDGPEDISVAGMLDYLNYNDDIINDAGEKSTRIGWECSCLQGICGACAMVINDMPALACETFLRDLKGDAVVLRPLRKFPVIHDLIVNRDSIHENLKMGNVYIGEYQPKDNENHRHQYDAAKCLKCGLCLEVCPNYTNGKTFYGALFANDCYLVSARNREKSKDISRVYGEHFAGGCSKSLSCMDVCPMKIPTLASMAKLNRIS
ncbi:MAG: succinate dehydrogenase/fumarate reductase iron-sulfur subunit [Anaerolineaceae bacterium]|nr:succinate dehydrogenase/fumarate reductase iron-sulfur subunit [Anaerolineaceae bacterium]